MYIYKKKCAGSFGLFGTSVGARHHFTAVLQHFTAFVDFYYSFTILLLPLSTFTAFIHFLLQFYNTFTAFVVGAA